MNQTKLPEKVQLIKSAMPHLLALAAAVRPDWNPDETHGALVATHQRGWPWPRTLRETVDLLCNEKAGPRDLAAAASNPLRWDVAREPQPDTYERGLAAVRDAMFKRGTESGQPRMEREEAS